MSKQVDRALSVAIPSPCLDMHQVSLAKSAEKDARDSRKITIMLFIGGFVFPVLWWPAAISFGHWRVKTREANRRRAVALASF